jgi:hypothetical protein
MWAPREHLANNKQARFHNAETLCEEINAETLCEEEKLKFLEFRGGKI